MAPHSHLITTPYPLRGQERDVVPHSLIITTPYPYVGRSVTWHRNHIPLPHPTHIVATLACVYLLFCGVAVSPARGPRHPTPRRA